MKCRVPITPLIALLFVTSHQSYAAENADDKAPLSDAGPAEQPLLTITVDDARKMAASYNPAMKNIEEVVYQADTTIYQAWTMLLPNLSVKASITRNQQEVAFTMPALDPVTGLPTGGSDELVIQELWGKTFGYSANITLFNPRSIPAIKMAYEMADRERVTAQIRKESLLSAVTNAFYQVSAMEKMIEVSEKNLEMTEQFLNNSKALKRAGQTTKIDVLRAEIQVMDAQKLLDNAKDSYALAKTGLGFLIGIEGDYAVTPPAKMTPENRSLDELTKLAFSKRVEFEGMALDKNIAERSKNELLTQWLPSFDVTYSWNWNSAEGFSGRNASWLLIFGAQWKIFQGGQRITEARIRDSRIRMQQNNMEQLAIDIGKEVDEKYKGMTKSQRNVLLAEKQLSLAEENHHLVSRQYEAGIVTSLDVLNATTELGTKRINQVLEQLWFDLAIVALIESIGEYYPLAVVPRDTP